MSQTETHNLSQMPPSEQIATDAIKRLSAEGYRSQLMKLPAEILREVAKRLVTPEHTKSEVLDWLNGRIDQAIDDNAFYRFAQRFSETYRTVWGEYASQLVTANIPRDEEDQTAELHAFAKQRSMQLISQELLAARSPEDLDTKRLSAFLSALRSYDRTQIEYAELELAKQQAEQQAERHRLDAERLRQQISQVPDRVKNLQKRLDQLENSHQRDLKIDPAIFETIRAELAGLAEFTEADQGSAAG